MSFRSLPLSPSRTPGYGEDALAASQNEDAAAFIESNQEAFSKHCETRRERNLLTTQLKRHQDEVERLALAGGEMRAFFAGYKGDNLIPSLVDNLSRQAHGAWSGIVGLFSAADFAASNCEKIQSEIQRRFF